jgi:hypothetical protein
VNSPNKLSNLVNALTEEIFASEYRRLQKRSIMLVKENTQLGGKPDGFFYRSKLFSDLDPRLRFKGDKGNPHKSLIPALENYLADQASVDFDKIRVHQALVVILKPCKSNQDVIDAVPNTLHEVLGKISPEYSKLSRSRQEAWSVLDNPQNYHQYMKLREKIEFYNTAKLLY